MDSGESRKTWRQASIGEVAPAAEGMIRVVVHPRRWKPHLPGQYYDIRIPGSRHVRSFSIVSSPTATDRLEFGVQLLPKGLVSSRLASARPGDLLEIRGPIGRVFTWSPETPGRLVLFGAGAGITPLISMFSYARERGGAAPIFVVTAKRRTAVFEYETYRSDILLRVTSEQPRIDRKFVEAALRRPLKSHEEMNVRICGPLGFIGSIVEILRSIGVPDEAIRSEAFV